MPNRSDNFNRADSTSALGAASDGLGSWTAHAGTWGIISNRAYLVSGTMSTATLESSLANVDIEVTLSDGSDRGICARLQDGSNYLALFVIPGSPGTLRLWRVVGGSFTSLALWNSGAVNSGDVIRFRVNGTTLEGYQNGTLRLSATESTYQTNTRHGFVSNGDVSSRWDDLSITEVSGGGDTTPPTLTSPTGTGGLGVCSGSVSTNEGNGTLFAVATASATTPTALQVRNGQDHTGSSAGALRVISQAVSSSGTQTIASGAITGGAGTRYLHYMHEDPAGNRSAVVSSAGFSVTATATQLVVTVPDAAGLTGFSGFVLSAAAPGSGVTVIATPTAISFNGSGQATISISGLGVPVGARRWVSVTNSTGDPAQSPAPVQAQGPVTAS